ncbi:MAG: Mesaconyl-CoA hydratase, partial [uncultured Solirubrobacteraceae bacterium]
EPPPAAPQRRLRRAVPAGPQRRGGAPRLLPRARDERLRRVGQGDRQPRHGGAQAPRTRLPRRHALRGVRGSREEGVALQARPRHGQGPHPRAQSGRGPGRRVQAARARPPAAGRHDGARGGRGV